MSTLRNERGSFGPNIEIMLFVAVVGIVSAIYLPQVIGRTAPPDDAVEVARSDWPDDVVLALETRVASPGRATTLTVLDTGFRARSWVGFGVIMDVIVIGLGLFVVGFFASVLRGTWRESAGVERLQTLGISLLRKRVGEPTRVTVREIRLLEGRAKSQLHVTAVDEGGQVVPLFAFNRANEEAFGVVATVVRASIDD